MTAYNTALGAVTQADYTTSTWTAYQLVVTANVVTDQDSQTAVDAATLAITTAQGALVKVAVTEIATDVTSTDATLNGVNGSADATGHSFWVSLATFDTSSSTIPADVYSTPDLGAIAANAPFSASLSSITTTGVPTNLPAVTPNTTYYFVAWSNIGGTWYPGTIKTFTTGN